MSRKWSKWVVSKSDSKWEEKLRVGVMVEWEHHPAKIEYTKPVTHHTYRPDWKVTRDETVIYVEAKGRFRESAEYKKYIYIRDSLQDHEELVFLFMKRDTAMPNAKTRRDGTKRTMEEWAEAEGFRYFYEDNIDEVWDEV